MRTQTPFMPMDFDSSSPLGILDRIGWWGALGMIAVALVYTFFMLIVSRGPHGTVVLAAGCATAHRHTHALPQRGGGHRRQYQAAHLDPGSGLRIMVIDDGSDDDTAQVAAQAGDERVEVVRRRPPHARLGKGEALNDALSIVRSRCTTASSSRVVVGVMDADGRLDPHAIEEVRRAFAPQEVAPSRWGYASTTVSVLCSPACRTWSS